MALFDLPAPNWTAAPTVRAVNMTTAARWFAKYHYLGNRHPASRDWGVFAPDLMAVVAVGESANVSGLAGRFDLGRWKGNKEITRVAVSPDAPTNTASRVISAVCHELAHSGLEWVFSYADTGQGHHGGIYQALNAIYVGPSAACSGYLLDGVPVHPRQVVRTFGTRGSAAFSIAASRGQTLVRVPEMISAKHTYILPIGPPKTRAAIRRHLRDVSQPYPKRAEGVGETPPANQPGSDDAMSSLRS